AVRPRRHRRQPVVSSAPRTDASRGADQARSRWAPLSRARRARPDRAVERPLRRILHLVAATGPCARGSAAARRVLLRAGRRLPEPHRVRLPSGARRLAAQHPAPPAQRTVRDRGHARERAGDPASRARAWGAALVYARGSTPRPAGRSPAGPHSPLASLGRALRARRILVALLALG